MKTSTLVVLALLVVFLGSLGAVVVLLALHLMATDVGVPYITSIITLVLGAVLALVDPKLATLVLNNPSAPVVAPQAAPGAPVAQVTQPAPALDPATITGQAAAPAMPGA